MGYHVQANPQPSAIASIDRLQMILVDVLPIALHPIPPEALHLSVATLIPADEDVAGVGQRWSSIEKSIARWSPALDRSEPLTINFEEVRISENAVILATAVQPGWLVDARRGLRLIVEEAGLRAARYDIAHMTLARFAGNGSISRDAWVGDEDVRAPRISFEPLRLVRETRYPSLALEVLTSY